MPNEKLPTDAKGEVLLVDASFSDSSLFAEAENANTPSLLDGGRPGPVMGPAVFSSSVVGLVLAIPSEDEGANIGSSLLFPDGSSTWAGVGVGLGLDKNSGIGFDTLSEPFTPVIPELPELGKEFVCIGSWIPEAADGATGTKEETGVDAGAGAGIDDCGSISAFSSFGFGVIPKPANSGGGATD